MKTKKILAFLLVLALMAALFVGCDSKKEEPDDAKVEATEQKPQDEEKEESNEEPVAEDKYMKINVCITSDPGTLAPWAGATGQGKGVVSASLYEALFVLEELGGEMHPRIASGYEQLDDVTYRISLFENVYDTAGNQITADDVVFSYKTASEMGNMATFLSSYKDIVKVDDYTVDLTLTGTAIGGLMNTTTFVYIVDQGAYEADPDGMANNPIATGPYKLSAWTPGSTVALVKNDDYWQAPDKAANYSKQNVDEIEYKIITEPNQIAIALETGDIDFAADVAQSDLIYFNDGGFTVLSLDAALSQIILFNCSPDAPTASKELRQAIAYAIDSQALIDGAYDGVGSVCKTYGNSVYGDYLEKWDSEDYYDYNPDKAAEMLAASDYNGESIIIMTGMLSTHKMMAQIIQAYLTEAGITSEIVSYDDTLYSNYRWDPTQWHIQLTNKGSGDYVASTWRYSFDQSFFGGATQGFYTDEAMQELLVKCLDESTHTPENMDAFHKYMKDVLVGYGLLFSKDSYVFVDTMEEVVINPQNAVVPGACTYSADFESH